MQKFDDVFRELVASHFINPKRQQQSFYVVDCQLLIQTSLKDSIKKKEEILVRKMEANKIDWGTQTYTTYVGKQHIACCFNCRSREHYYKDCKVPYRSGFYRIFGMDGKNDGAFSHDIKHEQALWIPGLFTRPHDLLTKVS